MSEKQNRRQRNDYPSKHHFLSSILAILIILYLHSSYALAFAPVSIPGYKIFYTKEKSSLSPNRPCRECMDHPSVCLQTHSSSHSLSKESNISSTSPWMIRHCTYAELKQVSEIIVQSFYTDSMRSSPFSAVLKIGEWNRLQQNFPYYKDRHLHRMLVATTTTDPSTIIGFVDLDVRPPTRRIDPPRPYLSDLAVHPNYRRCGIASQLINTCEMTVRFQWDGFGTTQDGISPPSPSSEMYIRVERDNEVAIQMYQKLQYVALSHPIFGVEDTTVLLRKNLSYQVDT